MGRNVVVAERKGLINMNRREMRKRVAGIIAINMPGYTARVGLKSLEEQLDDELFAICNFKEPSRAKRERWNLAIHEIRMIIFNHAGLGD